MHNEFWKSCFFSCKGFQQPNLLSVGGYRNKIKKKKPREHTQYIHSILMATSGDRIEIIYGKVSDYHNHLH